jgi:hypothetical protein
MWHPVIFSYIRSSPVSYKKQFIHVFEADLKAQLFLHWQLKKKKIRTIVKSDQNNLRLSFHSTSLFSSFPSCIISYGPPILLALVPICLKKQICTQKKKKSIHENKTIIVENLFTRSACLQSSSFFIFFKTYYCLYYLLLLLF